MDMSTLPTTHAAFLVNVAALKSQTPVVGLCYKVPSIDLPSELTAAERRIVRGLLSGSSNCYIAVERLVSVRTVAAQLQQLYTTYGVNSRHALLARLLNANGENLNAGHVVARTRVFPGDPSVFDSETVFGALDLGDGAVISAHASWRDPIDLWERLLRGELAIVARRTLGDLRFVVLAPRRQSAGQGNLSTDDIELLKGLGSGCSNRQLARELGVSQSRLSEWGRQALGKLGLDSRAELLRMLSNPAQRPALAAADA
jgi:DNA-binding NarL/FixJ family response regulator